MPLYLTIFIASLVPLTAAASEFRTYQNGRFGYVIDLPSDFRTVRVPENGDGIGLESVDGRTKLSVWGNQITAGGFREESNIRQKFESDDGWKFTYEKRSALWVSLSGTKGDHIIYMRQIALCNDAMGNFSIQYPATQQKRLRPIIERMVKTLVAPKHCD